MMKERGFTLIEVLVALAIFAGGVMLVIEGLGRSESATRTAQTLLTSFQLAEEELTQAKVEVLQTGELEAGSFGERVTRSGRDYEKSRSVETVLDAEVPQEEGAAELHQVNVEVNWTEGGRGDQKLRLGTFVTLPKKQ